MLTQVTVTFALVCNFMGGVRLLVAGFGEGNHFFGNADGAMLKNIALTAVTGTIYQHNSCRVSGSFAFVLPPAD